MPSHRPNLIDPTPVVIERVEKDTTIYDRDAREPTRTLTRSTVTIPAQLQHVRRGNPVMQPIGADEQIRGHFTVRRYDLEKAGYEPKRGDKIVKIGKYELNVERYISQVQWHGHHGRDGGATLMRLYYVDRRPAAGSPAMH